MGTMEMRRFSIRAEVAEEDQERLANFLRGVDVERIDTAYADGCWQVLVLYRDLRAREEAAQIESAIVAALNGWRSKTARSSDVAREMVLADETVARIARSAPTTLGELKPLIGDKATLARPEQILSIVRSTLADLTE